VPEKVPDDQFMRLFVYLLLNLRDKQSQSFVGLLGGIFKKIGMPNPVALHVLSRIYNQYTKVSWRFNAVKTRLPSETIIRKQIPNGYKILLKFYPDMQKLRQRMC
jgi:hypothetical protein